MNILYLIPARGGSKGIPKKNIKKLANKPLINYSIDVARELTSDDNICVSTDSEEIKKIVEEYDLKVPFLRPNKIATDNATTESVIEHALEYYQNNGKNYDYVILLQPTSPLRTANHIKEAINIINNKTEIIVSVKETDSNPYYVMFEEDEYGFLKNFSSKKFTRRQDCPTVYEVNGAIYVISVEHFLNKGLSNLRKQKVLMNKISSIDIDDYTDFQIVELIIQNGLIE